MLFNSSRFDILKFQPDSEALGSKLQFLPLHCLAIFRGDLSTKKTKPKIEK